jgi:hypothetical protein
LLAANFSQSQPEPAEFLRHRGKQIFCFPQLFEIFQKKPVLPIISSSSLSTTLQQLI